MKRIYWLLIFFFATHSLFAQDHVPGDILVQFKSNVASKTGQFDSATMSQNDLTTARCVSASWNIWLLKTTPGNENNAIGFLSRQPGVMTVQLNHYLQKRGVIPNDSLFSAQWNLHNSANPGIDINATNAWTISTGGFTALGDTIVIAVIDGGMDITHEDLSFWKNNREIPNNGIDDDHNGYIDDYNGWNAYEHDDNIDADPHGTHVCGIAGAKGNNLIGICGVNWNVLIMPLELFTYSEDEVVEAYTYIYDQRTIFNNSNGAKGTFVVATNSSFGIDYGQPSDYPLWCAMYDSLGKAGILSAAATTNNGVNVDDVGDVPTACPSNYLVTVTDMMSNGHRNASAGFGPTTIDLEAPGTGITSTLPFNAYGELSGTSMASPHVAGAIALMYSAGCVNFIQAYHDAPDSIALKVKQYLLAGVDTTADMLGNSVSGGRLDVYNSIERMLNDFCVTCISANIDTQSVTCYGCANGSASVSISGGKQPYSILWSTGQTTAQISGLDAGSYSVKVSDAANCTKYIYFKLFRPDSLIAGYTVTPSDSSKSNGEIITQVEGGVPPYTFKWSNGDTTQDLKGIADGTYYITITDADHAYRVDTINVGITGITAPNLQGQIKTFPNPTTGDVQLVLPASFNNITVEIVDLPGQILWSSQLSGGNYTLPVSSFEKGIYMLRFRQGDMEFVRKIVRL